MDLAPWEVRDRSNAVVGASRRIARRSAGSRSVTVIPIIDADRAWDRSVIRRWTVRKFTSHGTVATSRTAAVIATSRPPFETLATLTKHSSGYTITLAHPSRG
jgi:hypothetical protein